MLLRSNRIREIFDRLDGLEFVCLEQVTATREENAEYLAEQMKYIIKGRGREQLLALFPLFQPYNMMKAPPQDKSCGGAVRYRVVNN